MVLSVSFEELVAARSLVNGGEDALRGVRLETGGGDAFGVAALTAAVAEFGDGCRRAVEQGEHRAETIASGLLVSASILSDADEGAAAGARALGGAAGGAATSYRGMVDAR